MGIFGKNATEEIMRTLQEVAVRLICITMLAAKSLSLVEG